MLSKHMYSWSGRLGTIKATIHTIDLKEAKCPIHQQPYLARQRSLDVLREHMDKKLEAGVIKPV